MKLLRHQAETRAFTLIEVLCTLAIIAVLAALLLGPASRILQRVRADQWADQAGASLAATVEQLNARFRGRRDFPLVTLERIEAERLVRPAELRFLKDRRVTFIPFAGPYPDEMIVIGVRLDGGFFTGADCLTASKEAITRMPD